MKHRIDVLGALLLGGGVTCLLLALSHTGTDAPWTSPRTHGPADGVRGRHRLVRGVGAPGGRATAPVAHPGHADHRARTFANLVAGIGFTCGIIYPPVFFQAVAGVDASKSGLLLAPFAFTCAVSTLAAGQITDRIGGYKALPLIGMVFLGAGYALLGTITAATSAAAVMSYAMVAGVGVGFVMQTLLYVVQRSSSVRDIGVATSTVMLFRVLGSSLGVAVLGSAFTSTLTSEVDERLPGFPTSEIQGAPQKIAALAPDVQAQLHDAFATSLATAFRVAVPFMVIGFVAVAFLPAAKVRRRMKEAHDHVVTADAVAHGA